MSFLDYIEMLIGYIMPIGIIITIVPSFVVFCVMKAWKIAVDIVMK